MTPKPFRIFRAGTHVDSSGQSSTFTTADLQAMVTAYNEGEWRAPLVCGHPKGHAPAYGWVGKLRLDDQGEVWCDALDDLHVDMAEAMANKAYRNRSASLYAPDHPGNPTPGVWQVRHLGLLGAQAPAIKGLGDVEFGDTEDGITVEFSSYTTSTIAGLLRRLRDNLIGKWGVEDADKALPAFLIEDLEANGRQEIEATVPNYSEPEATTMTPEQIAALQAQAAKATQLEADLAAANTRADGLHTQVQSYSEREATTARAVALVEAKGLLQPLVAAGKLLPAQLDQAAEFMAGLDNQARTFEFGEHTGEKKLTARGFLAALIAAQPTSVEYGEHAAATVDVGTMTPEQLGNKAKDYREAQSAKGNFITAAQAVDAVLAGAGA